MGKVCNRLSIEMPRIVATIDVAPTGADLSNPPDRAPQKERLRTGTRVTAHLESPAATHGEAGGRKMSAYCTSRTSLTALLCLWMVYGVCNRRPPERASNTTRVPLPSARAQDVPGGARADKARANDASLSCVHERSPKRECAHAAATTAATLRTRCAPLPSARTQDVPGGARAAKARTSISACSHACVYGTARQLACILYTVECRIHVVVQSPKRTRCAPVRRRALTETAAAEHARLPRARTRRKPHKRRRRNQKRFDSTLGFPGEGPRIVSWNAAGLSDMNKLEAMLCRARKEGWDALVVQEVKWGSKREIAAARRANNRQYDMYCTRGPSKNAGGVAVFVDRKSNTVKATGKARHELMGYCAVPVTIEGHKSRIVGMYVPVEKRLQKHFLQKLREKKLLNKDDVVCADFNCVADPDLDACRANGTRYDPKHGAMCEAILCDAGLCDTMRAFHGLDARAYTRFGATVNTRLDRIYTRSYNAEWRIVGHGHQHKMQERSDHSAVVLEIEVAPPREATPMEEKIDPVIMRDESVRRDVRDLWKQAYAERPIGEDAGPPGYLRAQAWQHAKNVVAQYLLSVTKERRQRAKPKVEILRNQLQKVLDAATTPSAQATQRRKELRDAIEKERKATRPRRRRGGPISPRCVKKYLRGRFTAPSKVSTVTATLVRCTPPRTGTPRRSKRSPWRTRRAR